MRNLGALSVLLLVGTGPAFAQESDEKLRAELIRVHTEWFAAFDKGDGATMDRLEVSNFYAVFPDGRMFKKSRPRAGGEKPTTSSSRTLSDVDARQFGDMAILTGVLATEPSLYSSPDKAATTVMFVRDSGNWRIASGQWTAPTDPEAVTNIAGYQLLEAGKIQEAIEVLKVNVKLFPQSWGCPVGC